MSLFKKSGDKPPQPPQSDNTPKVAAQWSDAPVAGVKRIIAVASGKGGVGKSTTTVMLAHAMHEAGESVAIMDADIYGPSVPRMLGVSGQPELKDSQMIPHYGHGIGCNSMGFLLPEGGALVWRGPMLSKALKQLSRMTRWQTEKGEDVTLLIDLPPGTGDVPLSLAQQMPIDAVVLVTTPQAVALDDVQKSADMFKKVHIPIIGVIENMSWLEQADGTKQALFGEGGGQTLADDIRAPLLGQIPLQPALGKILDNGHAPDATMLTPYQAIWQSMQGYLA
jgi:ATP-binding protein involved in chromosome partitioning